MRRRLYLAAFRGPAFFISSNIFSRALFASPAVVGPEGAFVPILPAGAEDCSEQPMITAESRSDAKSRANRFMDSPS
jgi:hypothetical protein